MNSIKVTSGSPFEDIIGFSRAVKVGDYIAVSGTAPLDKDGKTYGIGDSALQARQCFEIIKKALRDTGSDIKDVIRTRIFLKYISDWNKIALIHAEYFKHIKPATTVIEVSGFVNPEWLVEIEVDAIITCNKK